MKITIFAFCLLFATAAFGQTAASVLSNTPQPTVIPEHIQHATQHAMATENSLLGNSAYTYAQGEQPVVDFGSLKQETPLGDVARAYRKGHVLDKKAVVVLEND